MKRTFLFIALCIVAACSCWAQVGTEFQVKDVYGNKLYYQVTANKKVKVLRRKSYKKMTNVTIPALVEHNGTAYEVSELEGGLFYGCDKLVEVELPNTIKELPYYWSNYYKNEFHGAFESCTSLSKVLLSNSIAEISASCFKGCSSLTEINLPANLRIIGRAAFHGCSSLESLTIPSKVKTIGSSAFCGCASLKGISIPNSVTKIDTYVFSGCISLVNVVLPDSCEFSCTKYGTYDIFYGCSSLENLILPNNFIMPKYAGHWIDGCNNLTNIKYHNGKVPSIKDCSDRISCPFFLNEGKLEDPEFDKKLLANVKYVSSTVEEKNSGTILPEPKSPLAIDQNIPANAANNKNTFAVIIGNERYTQVAQVPYANNDARIFAEYCKKTLGLPAQNVRVYENATFGTILSAIADVRKIAEAYSGNINVMFYYAGHGVPNESTKDAYLLPVDADGQQTEACYPVSRLYKELGVLGAKNVVVFMDACFSGAQRGDGMLASARGVALKAKAEVPQGNMVVFSAASGDETAYPYKEKGHGLFTYFLLKKLQESKGDCTLGELGEYIQTNVRQQSVVVNRKSQTPTVVPSANIANDWKNLKLR